MKTTTRWLGASILLVATPLLMACDGDATAPEGSPEALGYASLASSGPSSSFEVSGSSIHYISTGIVHTQDPTADGLTQRATEIVRLSGDLNGYILYHPTSVFDFGAGTLVNTGTQIFSGTVAGSDPVILHDDRYRFEVDLASGETLGKVHLGRSKDAPHPGAWYECDLVVVDAGQSPAGDYLGSYTGTCTRRGKAG